MEQLSMFGQEDTSEQMPGNIPQWVQYGDIWQLGEHKLICADAASAHDVARLFDGERFALCFTSPPYSDQRSYKIGSFDWHSMMCGSFDRMIENGREDCHILINLGLKHENRQVDMYWLEWLMQCAIQGWPLFGWYTWDKGFGMPGEWHGRLAPAHEFVFHFKKGNGSINKWMPANGGSRTGHLFRENNGEIRKANSPTKIGQKFKIPDSVIRIQREMQRTNTGGMQTKHPAVFPVALPEFIMKTWSQPGDIVYEPFCGSGTSLIAGSNLKRRVYACEVSHEYCDLILARWEQYAKEKAVLVERIAQEVAS